jgi:hypothetical protein
MIWNVKDDCVVQWLLDSYNYLFDLDGANPPSFSFMDIGGVPISNRTLVATVIL